MSNLPKRVLAIGAHPDDVDMYCSGTLARFLRAGSTVDVAVVCRGDKGGGELAPEELADQREREARQAAEILGTPIHFLGVGDAEARDTPQTRRQFLELLQDPHQLSRVESLEGGLGLARRRSRQPPVVRDADRHAVARFENPLDGVAIATLVGEVTNHRVVQAPRMHDAEPVIDPGVSRGGMDEGVGADTNDGAVGPPLEL